MNRKQKLLNQIKNDSAFLLTFFSNIQIKQKESYHFLGTYHGQQFKVRYVEAQEVYNEGPSIARWESLWKFKKLKWKAYVSQKALDDCDAVVFWKQYDGYSVHKFLKVEQIESDYVKNTFNLFHCIRFKENEMISSDNKHFWSAQTYWNEKELLLKAEDIKKLQDTVIDKWQRDTSAGEVVITKFVQGVLKGEWRLNNVTHAWNWLNQLKIKTNWSSINSFKKQFSVKKHYLEWSSDGNTDWELKLRKAAQSNSIINLVDASASNYQLAGNSNCACANLIGNSNEIPLNNIYKDTSIELPTLLPAQAQLELPPSVSTAPPMEDATSIITEKDEIVIFYEKYVAGCYTKSDALSYKEWKDYQSEGYISDYKKDHLYNRKPTANKIAAYF